jgi:hypothetical protein
MRHTWSWIAWGVIAIGVGLTIWYTAFVLVPVGLILIAVGTAKSLRRAPDG